jgi:hypothetical protein
VTFPLPNNFIVVSVSSVCYESDMLYYLNLGFINHNLVAQSLSIKQSEWNITIYQLQDISCLVLCSIAVTVCLLVGFDGPRVSNVSFDYKLGTTRTFSGVMFTGFSIHVTDNT